MRVLKYTSCCLVAACLCVSVHMNVTHECPKEQPVTLVEYKSDDEVLVMPWRSEERIRDFCFHPMWKRDIAKYQRIVQMPDDAVSVTIARKPPIRPVYTDLEAYRQDGDTQ